MEFNTVIVFVAGLVAGILVALVPGRLKHLESGDFAGALVDYRAWLSLPPVYTDALLDLENDPDVGRDFFQAGFYAGQKAQYAAILAAITGTDPEAE